MERMIAPYTCLRALEARSVLVLAPHPDDEVFGCGGAIIRHVLAGVPVRVVICTDGAFGLVNDARESYRQVREEESRHAARVLGYGSPDFWRLPDRSLAYSKELARRIGQEIAASGADLVYAPSEFEIHPDHLALALAARDAVAEFPKVRVAMYEVGSPLPVADVLIDISDVAAVKERAMACFPSQLAHQHYARQISGLNCYRSYTLAPSVSAAEAFTLAQAADEVCPSAGGHAERTNFVEDGTTPGESPSSGSSMSSLYRSRLAHFGRALMEAEARIDERNRQLHELQGYLGDLQGLLQRRQADVDQQQVRLDTLQLQIGRLQYERDAVLTSTSWRVTLPLRVLMGSVRRAVLRLHPGAKDEPGGEK